MVIDPCNTALLAGTPTTGLELDHLSLALLVASQLEVLAALQGSLLAVLALCALHTQHNLLGGLGLLPEDGLSLATKSLLLAVVTTTTLGGAALLGLFVLGHLVQFVAPALLAEGLALLGNVHLQETRVNRLDACYGYSPRKCSLTILHVCQSPTGINPATRKETPISPPVAV